MEKFSKSYSKSELFLNSIVKSLSEELTEKISETITDGNIENCVFASVDVKDYSFEIEYHSDNSNESFMIISKPNNNDQYQNIEKYILSHMDFSKIENDAFGIYENQKFYISGEC